MSLLWRNIFFTLLQPGMVAGLIPYLITRHKLKEVYEQSLDIIQYTGLFIGLIGIVITGHCIIRFGKEGKGTLSPADPTRKLVVSGLYKYSRNPMYVGVIMILAGEWMFVQEAALGYYVLLIFAAFNIFIISREEPRLTNDFGEDYIRYRQRVRRWF